MACGVHSGGLAFCLGVLADVLSQLVFPLQDLLLRDHAPHDSYASLPKVIAEGLGRIVNVLEVDLRNGFAAELDDERDLFPQMPK